MEATHDMGPPETVDTRNGTVHDADPKRRPRRDLTRGIRIGRYLIREHLGSGAMGVVYGALDTMLDREVALKVVRAARPGDAARLEQEARALARLSHPNVVIVYDAGRTENGDAFVAMERIPGQTLRAWLARPRQDTEVRRVFAAAGQGLLAAHEARIVHRDFKPDNVMVDPTGRTKILDFGISCRVTEALIERGECRPTGVVPWALTRSGTLMGTPAYMAPEQYFDGSASIWSDQFSFCVALWEALYGERPFVGQNMREMMLSVVREGPRRPTGARIDRRLHQCLLRGLAPEPERRWPTLEPILRELDRAPRIRQRIVHALPRVDTSPGQPGA